MTEKRARARRRPYSSPLRRSHQEATRTRIMEAVAGLIADGRLADFSIRELAARAEVSYASVYRHFKSRDEVLNGMYDWVDQTVLKWDGRAPKSLAELPDAIRATLTIFEEHAVVSAAVAVALAAQGVEPETRRRRHQAVEKMVAAAAPSMTPARVREVSATISHLTSSLTWATMRKRFRLSPEETAGATTWAVETLIRAATSEGKPLKAKRSRATALR